MKRTFFAHEAVQSSQMDCGPAALKCVLEGYKIPISFGRLRDACQTGLDGTSIDALETVCNQLGLQADQMMLPRDHLLLPEAQLLPAIAVTYRPGGGNHFVVIWRQHGHYLQIMDPASGRQWVHHDTFRQQLYEHHQQMRASEWFAWASTSRSYIFPLIQRLVQIGIPKSQAEVMTVSTLKQQDWYALATLDAAARAVLSFKKSGHFPNAKHRQALLEELINGNASLIPSPYWNVRHIEGELDQDPIVMMSGAVFIHINGRTQATQNTPEETEQQPPIPQVLQTALQEESPNAAKTLWRFIQRDGRSIFFMLAIVLLIQSMGVMLEALLLRGFMEIGQSLQLPELRISTGIALVTFAIAMFLLQFPVTKSVLTIGRKLETRLRLALLEKIPNISDRYFQSRLTGDVAERNHNIHFIRQLPSLVQNFSAATMTLCLTTAGLIWLAPNLAHWIIFTSITSIAVPFAMFPLLAERDMKTRALEAGLSRFYLDALKGAAPIKAHGATKAIRSEYERQLTTWTRASFDLLNASVVMRLQILIGTALTWFIVWRYQHTVQQTSGMLLLVYWLLQLPGLGEQIASYIQQYPIQRNLTLRLLELLLTPEEESDKQTDHKTGSDKDPATSIQMKQVGVRVGDNHILNQVDLDIHSGEHVAVVGPSGAGKSSLVGLLLGWHEAWQGQILINGQPLTPSLLHGLRRQTAWLDPSVTLWNQTLLDNLNYGNSGQNHTPHFDQLIEQAQLLEVVSNQPQGFQSVIGDNGALLSGGEGQRVRFGRALLKKSPRLVILDEAFRGLDHQSRQNMLNDARRHWQKQTLIYISHDQHSALDFDRVLVIDQGRVIQDGNPKALAQEPGLFNDLLKAEQEIHQALWQHKDWRHLSLDQGQLREDQA